MKLTARMALAAAMLICASGADAGENRWVRVEGGTWAPNAETVSRIRGRIEPFVRTQAESEGLKLGEWGSYTFQYEGYEENGKKLVFVNAVCSNAEQGQLNKQLILVRDGGTCFFNLSYDVEKDQLTGLLMNGEA